VSTDQEVSEVRNVVVYELLSLDGVAEDPIEFITEFDDVMSENLRGVTSSQDAVLLGRRTYDDWAQFWSGSDVEPFATFINGVQKFVATSTPLGHDWAKAARIDGDLLGFVAGLKDEAGGDIGVHGSISVAQALLEAGLVDRLCLVVAPAVQVNGRKLFERGKAARLSLTRTETSPAGYLLLDFELRR
jgi:dihydrofolate reductase